MKQLTRKELHLPCFGSSFCKVKMLTIEINLFGFDQLRALSQNVENMEIDLSEVQVILAECLFWCNEPSLVFISVILRS